MARPKIPRLLFALLFVAAGILIWKVIPGVIETPKVLMGKIEKGDGNPYELVKKLTYKVGPQEAIALINNSSLPKSGSTHLLAHVIGEVAYKMYGEKALPYCGEDALNGCAHGLFITAISDIGFEGIKKMVGNCKSLSTFKYHMCLHASGHALLALSDYDVYQGLEKCDKLTNSEDPELYHCYNGLFMENVHGEHDGKTPPTHPFLSKSDLLYPCNKVDKKYQSACYLNQAGWWLWVYGGDLKKVAQKCNSLSSFKRECADNFGRIISTLYKNDFDQIQKNCALLASPLNGYCLNGIAQSLFALGDKETPFALCNSIGQEEPKRGCFEEFVRAFGRHGLSQEEKETLCSKFDSRYRYLCKD